jgi:hypothetical protein
MNPNDLYEHTALERYSEFSSNSDQSSHGGCRHPQDRPYSLLVVVPQHDGSSGPVIDTYRPRGSHLHGSLLSQEPHERLWRWYLGHSNKQRFAIGCGVFISLLLLGAVFGFIASALPMQRQSGVVTVQVGKTIIDQVPTSTSVAMLIPDPTLMPTPLPSPQPTLVPSPTPLPSPQPTLVSSPTPLPSPQPTFVPSPTPLPSPQPTFMPSPTPTPEPIEKFNVTVTSQMVKKVSMQYRYIFDIFNNDSKSFGGSVTIELYNDSQQTPLGKQTFNMTQLLQPGLSSIVYLDNPTGPASQQSSNGITHFKYIIQVNVKEANVGVGQITDKYEDTSLF